MVSSQDSSPLKWSKHSLQWHPHGAALDNAHSFVSRGGRQGVAPASACTLLAHEEATLPCVSHCDNNVIIAVAVVIVIAIAVAVSVAVAIAVAIAIGHCHCHFRDHWPLPLPLPSAIAVGHRRLHLRFHHCHYFHRNGCCHPPSAITVAIAVGHCHCCCC